MSNIATLFKTVSTNAPKKRSRKKKTEEVPKVPKRIKKVLPHKDKAKEIIESSKTKCGRPKMPKHVMKINDWLYITCDKCTFKIVEVNNKINPKTGEKYPDKPFLYSPRLEGIIEVLMHYMLRDTPRDLVEMREEIMKLRELIMERIPADVTPKDLFQDLNEDDD